MSLQYNDSTWTMWILTVLYTAMVIAAAIACTRDAPLSEPEATATATVAATSAAPLPTATATVTPSPTATPTPPPGSSTATTQPQQVNEPGPPSDPWELLDQYTNSERLSLFILGVTVTDRLATVVYSVENADDMRVESFGRHFLVDEQDNIIGLHDASVLRSIRGLTVGTISFHSQQVKAGSSVSLTVDSFRAVQNGQHRSVFGDWRVEFLERTSLYPGYGAFKLVRPITADAAPVTSINLKNPSVLSFDLKTSGNSIPERIYLQFDGDGVREISYDQYTDIATGRSPRPRG